MILVDTNVWIEFFKGNQGDLTSLLSSGLVVTHEFVLEELVLGGLKNRDEHYHLLRLLTCYRKATHVEILEFINSNVTNKSSIGLVDSYLLSTALIENLQIYTNDRSLQKAAKRMRVAFKP